MLLLAAPDQCVLEHDLPIQPLNFNKHVAEVEVCPLLPRNVLLPSQLVSAQDVYLCLLPHQSQSPLVVLVDIAQVFQRKLASVSLQRIVLLILLDRSLVFFGLRLLKRQPVSAWPNFRVIALQVIVDGTAALARLSILNRIMTFFDLKDLGDIGFRFWCFD